MKRLWCAIKKESIEALRDRRALFTAFIYPVMIPIMFVVMINVIVDKVSSSDIKIAVQGAENLTLLIDQLDQGRDHYQLVDSDETVEDLLDDYQVVMVFSKEFLSDYDKGNRGRVELWSDSGNSSSGRVVTKVRRAMGGLEQTVATQRLLAQGVSAASLKVFDVHTRDIVKPSSKAAKLLGTMPSMIIIAAFICAMATAVDTTSGERERLSLEPLLVQPITPYELVMSKVAVISIFGWVGSALTLLLTTVVMDYAPLSEIGLSWNVTFTSLIVPALALIPLAILVSALLVLVALNAKSFKEAQTLLGILQTVPLVALVALDISEVEISGVLESVPVISQQHFIKAIIAGNDVGYGWIALGAVFSLSVAFILMYLASYRLKNPHRLLSN